MKLITRMNVIGALGLLVVAGGCTTSATDEAPTSTTRGGVTHETGSTEEAGEQGEGHRERGQSGGSGTAVEQEHTDHLGVVALIAEGLSKVGLNEQQRAEIEQLGKKVSPKEQAVIEARRELQEELSEQLAKGEIQENAFNDEIEELVSARMEASPVLRRALEDLHGILDEKQRNELVDAMSSAMQEHSRQAEGWFDNMAKDLKLTEDQKTKVKEVLMRAKPSLEQDRETAKEVFEAFRGDQFSIDQIVPLEEVGKRTREKARAMISVARSLTEILTPGQLDQLARMIEPQEEEEGPRLQRPGGSHEPGGNVGEQQEQGEPGHQEPGRPHGEQQEEGQQQQGPVGQVQSPQFFGPGIGGFGGFGAGYVRGGVSGWGGGFSAGRMTVMRSGYAAGYPFIGGYGLGVW